jgi:hypothetical protein
MPMPNNKNTQALDLHGISSLNSLVPSGKTINRGGKAAKNYRHKVKTPSAFQLFMDAPLLSFYTHRRQRMDQYTIRMDKEMNLLAAQGLLAFAH